MLAVFNAGGELITLTPSQVNQGSNKANTIYIVMPLAPTNVLQARFRLPNGKFTKSVTVPVATETGYLGFTDQDGNQLYMWSYTISAALTAYAGNVLAQFTATNNEQVIATFAFEFEVLEGVPPIAVEDIDSYQSIIEALQSINIAITNNVNTLQSEINELENTKQNKTDSALQTESKQVVGAINELKQDIEGIKDVGGSGTIVTVDGQAVSFFDADTKLDVDVFNAVMEQAQILTVDEFTNQYNEQVTANGESVLNRSKVQVKKVEGDTVSSTNLLSFPYYSGGIGPHERQGVTFDVQEDGSIHVYGTATGGDATFIVARNDNNTPFDFLQAGVIYKVGVADSGVNTVMQGASGYIPVTGNYTEILYNLAVYSYFFNVPNGTTVDTIIYPFINSSLGGFDRPLGGNLVNASFGGVESKARENLITVFTEGSTENNGITWTWNKDGSLSVKGTSNANGSTKVLNTGLDFKVQGEKYSVGEGSGGVYAYLKDSQGALTTIYSSNNSNISLDDYTEYGFYVPANTTVNTVIYPYITKGAITGYPPMSNKGVKSTWSFPKTSLPLGTTLDFETQKKTNTYAEYTFTGDESWAIVTSNVPMCSIEGVTYFRTYPDKVDFKKPNDAIQYESIICDRFDSYVNPGEKASPGMMTFDGNIIVMNGIYNSAQSIFLCVPSTVSNPVTQDDMRNLTKGMIIRYPTTAENTDWHKTEDFTADEINAGNSYEAYYEGTETILDNDGSEEGAKPTVTAEYVIVNKIGDET